MPAVVRRLAGPADDRVLRALFAESRDDLAVLPGDVRDVLIDLQYRAQRTRYRERFPNARRELLLLSGGGRGEEPVGYLVLDTHGPSVRIIDICVTTRERGHGIASQVVQDVLAAAGERSVRLAVWHANTTARRLYERLGFARRADLDAAEGYLELEHLPVPVGAPASGASVR